MSTLTVEVPDSALSAMRRSPEELARETAHCRGAALVSPDPRFTGNGGRDRGAKPGRFPGRAVQGEAARMPGHH